MKKNIIIISIVIIYLITTFYISIKYIDNKNNYVDKSYKIVFRGEKHERINMLYLWKTENGYFK